ncbi:hypothetical protein ACPXB3_15330 [Gordonia sp. DT219]|uniref:hypothetical protein n=1 Tax=Gordonia sp. DT219 TaxID=3416658 RepID=UPI003CF984C3
MSKAATVGRRRSTSWWIAGAALLVVGVVSLVVTMVFTRDSGSSGAPGTPVATVRAFLGAVADADSPGALRLMSPPPSVELLGRDASARQHAGAAITDISVHERAAHTSSAVSNSTATADTGRAEDAALLVDAGFRIGDRAVHTTYRVVRAGDRWLVADGFARVEISATRIPGLTLLGRPTTGARTVYVFPGRLVWGSGNRYLRVTDRSDVTGGNAPVTRVTPAVALTDAGTAASDGPSAAIWTGAPAPWRPMPRPTGPAACSGCTVRRSSRRSGGARRSGSTTW